MRIQRFTFWLSANQAYGNTDEEEDNKDNENLAALLAISKHIAKYAFLTCPVAITKVKHIWWPTYLMEPNGANR